ncbi:MAG: transporter associated domain-containing protein, partial [Clostridiaceae bacterium]
NKTVFDIMTHRMNISALPVESSFDDVISFVKTEKYSRIPVYENNIDNIIGVMYSKDLIEFLTDDKDKEKFTLKDIIKHPYFVPASKRTDELFKELQRNKTHLAIIIDEYGGTAGIVTLEDLIEEIMGNILDEDDEEERDIEKLDENIIKINGTTSLDAVRDYMDVDFPVEEYETLSGFLIGQLGRIPGKDENPVIEYKGLVFKVDEVDEHRIVKVKVSRNNGPEPLIK